MNAITRLICSLVAITSLMLCAPALADDVPADEAAEKRSEEFLKAHGETDISGSHHLGIWQEGKLIGVMSIDVKKAGEGYDFTTDMHIRVESPEGRMDMRQSEQGKLDGDLSIVSIKGESSQSAGEHKITKSYVLEAAGDKLKWSGAENGQAAPAVEHEDDTDSCSGIEVFASKLWIKLPAGQSHRLTLADAEDGDIAVVDVVASEKKTVKVGDKDHEAIELTVKNHTKGKTQTFVACCQTGALFEMRADGMPFEVRHITADEAKAWKDGLAK